MKEQEEEIRAQIRELLAAYPDEKFSGRAVARIFQGIGEGEFPKFQPKFPKFQPKFPQFHSKIPQIPNSHKIRFFPKTPNSKIPPKIPKLQFHIPKSQKIQSHISQIPSGILGILLGVFLGIFGNLGLEFWDLGLDFFFFNLGLEFGISGIWDFFEIQGFGILGLDYLGIWEWNLGF